MADLIVREIQNLKFQRPMIQRGYANQTLHINLSESTISIKPVGEEIKKIFRSLFKPWHMAMASAAAVASSSKEAFATSSPVRSITMV